LTISNWRLYVRDMLALASLLLAVSCATQPQMAQPSTPLPVVAPRAVVPSAEEPPDVSRPTVSHARANSSKVVRASYQGDATSGNRTANGERYDPDALTAASSTLPIGSTVMVTNPSTGRSVKVRINDRFHTIRGRSLDLSKHAGEEIGMTKKGAGRVEVKRVDSKSERHQAPDTSQDSSSTSTPKS
jgi:rare lipoprotein A